MTLLRRWFLRRDPTWKLWPYDEYQALTYTRPEWFLRNISSGHYPRPLIFKPLIWALNRVRIWGGKYRRWQASRRNSGTYRASDLMWAATARCGCGAGLAYPHNAGMNSAWVCSAVLMGDPNIRRDITHGHYPFVFYEIKSDCQPSARGATTRPGVKRMRIGLLGPIPVRE